MPEFDLEGEVPPMSLDDHMEEEINLKPSSSLFLNYEPITSQNASRKIEQNLKERVTSKSIFKKKNLSKLRQLKNGLNQERRLPVLALNKSTS